MNASPLISLRDLTIGYKKGGHSKAVMENINADIFPGELICLMGPNGAGKTTLLRTICGLLPPLSGKILIRDQPVTSYSPSELARLIGIVLTEEVNVPNMSVYSAVALGRYPYTNWLNSFTGKDEHAVREALEAAGLQSLVGRNINELSDGEQQKVMIARALAQQTGIIVLDEPTAYLDVTNKVEICFFLRELAEKGKAVVFSSHDLEIALQVAGSLWLFSETLVRGVPEDLVLDGSFEKAFPKKDIQFDTATGRFLRKREPGQEVFLEGDPVCVIWTRRAFEREGFACRTVKDNGDCIFCEAGSWTVYRNSQPLASFVSIAGLLEAHKTGLISR
jgi:iron complex transport system ATP-binding protein